MPRPLRCDSPLRVLNIGQKGHNGQVIFYYDEDREYYLECLQNACKKFEVVLFGYVLMSNHIHALFYGVLKNVRVFFNLLVQLMSAGLTENMAGRGRFGIPAFTQSLSRTNSNSCKLRHTSLTTR